MKTVLFSILILGVLGALFGAMLAVSSKVFHVETDPKQQAVRACLGGANCGGCGYPGCDGYAAAVAAGKAPANKCVAAGPEASAKIAEIMGVSNVASEKKVAFVPCSGCDGAAQKRFEYAGPKDCRAAMLFGGKSNKDCTFACIGFGNCVNACRFGAMSIVNGVAVVDREKCVGCGSCADACPKSIIRMISDQQHVSVACSNKDKGARTIKICSAGCIGCGKCARECPADAIEVVDNLAVIHPEKCVGCGHCSEICPRKVITWHP